MEEEPLDQWVYREFKVVANKGFGVYGRVYTVEEQSTGKLFALKQVVNAFQNAVDARRTYRQFHFLAQLKHKGIVRMQRVLSPGSRHAYALLEHFPTDLEQALRQCSPLLPLQRSYLGLQLLNTIAYLHSSQLVHRDVKPANLLLDPDNLTLKLCDFGLSRLRHSTMDCPDAATDYVAARWYRPPQTLLGMPSCDFTLDLWSAGCVLAQLLLRTPLFPGRSTLDQLQRILKTVGMPSVNHLTKLSQQAQFVMSNLSFNHKLTIKPLNQVLCAADHSQLDLISKLLRFDPAQRITAEQAIRHPHFDAVRSIDPTLFLLALPSKLNPQVKLPRGIDAVHHFKQLISQLATQVELKQTNFDFKDQQSTSQRVQKPLPSKSQPPLSALYRSSDSGNLPQFKIHTEPKKQIERKPQSRSQSKMSKDSQKRLNKKQKEQTKKQLSLQKVGRTPKLTSPVQRCSSSIKRPVIKKGPSLSKGKNRPICHTLSIFQGKKKILYNLQRNKQLKKESKTEVRHYRKEGVRSPGKRGKR